MFDCSSYSLVKKELTLSYFKAENFKSTNVPAFNYIWRENYKHFYSIENNQNVICKMPRTHFVQVQTAIC